MEEKELRNQVRSVLQELMQQHHPAYYVNQGSNLFPTDESDEIVRLPSDISPQEDYLMNWKDMSENDDLYNFPMEEFKKGIHVEKSKNEIFSTLDIAEKVINKLQENPHFYSNLGV